MAKVRRLPVARVNDLIDENTDGRQLGFLGEPGVNVLELNLALDREGLTMLDLQTLRPALIESFTKLDPRHQIRNPVMFVVEIGAVITTIGWLIQAFGGAPLGGGDEPAWFSFTVGIWLWLTVVFANLAEALAEGRGQGPGQGAPGDAHGDRRPDAGRRREAGLRASARRRGGGGGGRADPGRRHGDRGHRLGGRVRHHGRVRAGDPRVRRRPQRRDRRYPRAVRSHRRGDHAGAGWELPRPHDRAGRGRRAPQDPERDRPRASCSRA